VVFWVITRRRVVNNYHMMPCNYPEDHDIWCVYCEVGAELLSVFWRIQCFSAVIHRPVTVEAGAGFVPCNSVFPCQYHSTIVLCTQCHLNTTVIGRTSGQNLGTSKKVNALLNIPACETRMYLIWSIYMYIMSLMYFEITFMKCRGSLNTDWFLCYLMTVSQLHWLQ
jgi:hypothetical protein